MGRRVVVGWVDELLKSCCGIQGSGVVDYYGCILSINY